MKRKALGFTLIELMIVVAVAGILAAIAYPSYQDQVRKSRRSVATGALTEAASRMENFYYRSAGYTTDLTSLGYTASPQGFPTDKAATANYYNVSVVAADAGCPINSCFKLLATPRNGQASDNWRLRLWNTGRKESSTDGTTWSAGWPN